MPAAEQHAAEQKRRRERGRWAGLHVLLTKSFDEISNTSWLLTATVSFTADIHKSSFDQASG